MMYDDDDYREKSIVEAYNSTILSPLYSCTIDQPSIIFDSIFPLHIIMKIIIIRGILVYRTKIGRGASLNTRAGIVILVNNPSITTVANSG